MCKRWNELLIETKIFLLLDYTGSPVENYLFNFSQALIVFKKPFLLFSKMKISWSSNSSDFIIFYLTIFFWRFAHVFSLTISTKMCAENFFYCSTIGRYWRKLKNIWFLHVSRNQVFRFCFITTEQDKTKRFLHTFLRTLQTLQREYMLKILEEEDNLYLTNRL